MISFKKNLALVVLALAGCVSKPVCPSNLEKIKAGYYFMTASRMAESNKEEDLRMARRIYNLSVSLYFSGCKSEACHSEMHYCESLENVFEDLKFSKEEKDKAIRNLEKIRNEKALAGIEFLH